MDPYGNAANSYQQGLNNLLQIQMQGYQQQAQAPLNMYNMFQQGYQNALKQKQYEAQIQHQMNMDQWHMDTLAGQDRKSRNVQATGLVKDHTEEGTLGNRSGYLATLQALGFSPEEASGMLPSGTPVRISYNKPESERMPGNVADDLMTNTGSGSDSLAQALAQGQAPSAFAGTETVSGSAVAPFRGRKVLENVEKERVDRERAAASEKRNAIKITAQSQLDRWRDKTYALAERGLISKEALQKAEIDHRRLTDSLTQETHPLRLALMQEQIRGLHERTDRLKAGGGKTGDKPMSQAAYVAAVLRTVGALGQDIRWYEKTPDDRMKEAVRIVNETMKRHPSSKIQGPSIDNQDDGDVAGDAFDALANEYKIEF